MDYVVPGINKALRKMWWFALTAATLLYLLVFFKVVTPVLNYYSDYLLLPIAENIAPKDLHVSKVQLGWLNLSPIIILPKIDATDISSMPNVKDISSLSLSIDLFESILEQAVVVDYLYDYNQYKGI